jgi:hypothetical protein
MIHGCPPLVKERTIADIVSQREIEYNPLNWNHQGDPNIYSFNPTPKDY